MSNNKKNIAKKKKLTKNPPIESFWNTRVVGKNKYQHTDPYSADVLKRNIPHTDPTTPIDPFARMNHLFDTVAIAKFLVNTIEYDGMKILFDALKACKDANMPFMTAMVESEYTMFQHEMGIWYGSTCQDPPGEPGDRVTRARDLIKFRLFMKTLILNCGVERIEKLVQGQCPLVTHVFDLEKNSYYMVNKKYDRISSVNDKGKRVAALPIEFKHTRADFVITQQVSIYPALEMVAKEMKEVDDV